MRVVVWIQVGVRVTRRLLCAVRESLDVLAVCRGGEERSEWIDGRLHAGENKAQLYLREDEVAVTVLPTHNTTPPPTSYHSCTPAPSFETLCLPLSPQLRAVSPVLTACTEPVSHACVPLEHRRHVSEARSRRSVVIPGVASFNAKD